MRGAMTDPALPMVPGTVDLLILRTLAWQPMHGYGISRWIRERTENELDLQDAALYQALRRMERKGWLQAEWSLTDTNRRARFYRLTPKGRRHLTRELASWRRYSAAVARVLAPMPGEARS
jgi:PadR family transcriptional regulator, regulatory protein PadR